LSTPERPSPFIDYSDARNGYGIDIFPTFYLCTGGHRRYCLRDKLLNLTRVKDLR
jgi:hypothetical protein